MISLDVTQNVEMIKLAYLLDDAGMTFFFLFVFLRVLRFLYSDIYNIDIFRCQNYSVDV